MQCRETVGTLFEPQKRHALRAAKVTGASYTLILWIKDLRLIGRRLYCGAIAVAI